MPDVTHAPLEWDKSGERYYETGVRNAAIYIQENDGTYPKGIAWNGVTNVTEKPSGAEATPIWADDMKYLNIYSKEDFGASVQAYYYPPEFKLCDGTAQLTAGVNIGQQERKAFGMVYRTRIGNDIQGDALGYKIHLLYGCRAAASEKAYNTINDSPEAIQFSWELTTTPVTVAGANPTSIVTIDSTEFKTTEEKAKLAAFEVILNGSTEADARLPLPDEIKKFFEASDDQTDGQTDGQT